MFLVGTAYLLGKTYLLWTAPYTDEFFSVDSLSAIPMPAPQCNLRYPGLNAGNGPGAGRGY
jgi:hypothetical protein